MKKSITFAAATVAFTALFTGIAAAAGSPIANGSFQTGNFNGWTIHAGGSGGYGTATVQHCLPAAPGDTDGYCAVFSGSHEWGGQVTGSTNVHQYTINGCMSHDGTGQSGIQFGAVYFTIYNSTAWTCQSATYNNPTGSTVYLPLLFIYNSGGTAHLDQFTFTVNKP